MAAVAEVLCQHLVDHYIDIGRQSVASFPGSRRSIAVIVEHLTFRGSRDETAADKVVLERNPDMNLQPSAIRIDQVFDNLPVHNCDHVIAVLCVLSHPRTDDKRCEALSEYDRTNCTLSGCIRAKMVELPDLGYYSVITYAANVDETAECYRRLGFEYAGFNIPGESRTVVQGHNLIAFFDFYEKLDLNFRGPDIPVLATELRALGFEVVIANGSTLTWDEGRKAYAHQLPNNDVARGIRDKYPDILECGDFTVNDPDGLSLYFNTNPGERESLLDSAAHPVFPNGVSPIPVTFPLGDLVIRLSVVDPDASASFYRRLGFTAKTIEAGTLLRYTRGGTHTPRPGCPALLLQASAQTGAEIAFLCSDVDAAIRAVEAAGVPVQVSPPAIVDLDAREVQLISTIA